MRGLWVLLGVGCGAGPVTAETFDDRFVAGICDQETRCGPSWYLLDGEEGCTELVRERFGMGDPTGSDCVVFDAERGDACLEDLDLAACDARATDFVLPESCYAVWVWDEACEG